VNVRWAWLIPGVVLLRLWAATGTLAFEAQE
jgi:hypothetical protein